MSILRWLMEDKNQEPAPKFITKIDINPKSTLHVEVEPKDPTNCSNIVITAFASKQVRTIIPIRVEWSRFKIKSDAAHSVERIHCLVGNTYMCQPGDVGAYIRAVIKSVDDPKAEAEVTIGPIGIDVMMKRLIEGALYSGTLLSQVVCVEKQRKNNVTVRLNSTDIEFVDDNTGEKLVKDYSMSEPKIELNPKDATRVYLRFQQDQADEVREWLNLIFHVRNTSLNQSSMSEKVPYKSHSESSSKLRLFQKPERVQCINKLELRFISRNSRDLFLFTQRAFICRQDMKNTVYIQRIETLQNLATQEDYYRFLNYMTLKNEIIRLADLAKDLEDDRDAKVKDLIAMEESIGEMTLTYLKIIEEKGKNEHVDFEQSYSQINLTREEMLHRKNVRQLKKQNESLKQRLRQMNEQLQLLKFFKKEENESMIFNQTSNPFAKKGPELSVSYQVGHSPEDNKDKRKNMFDMSMNYTKLLEENNHLKKELMSNKKKTTQFSMLDKSKGMMELLGDLEKEELQSKFLQYESKIQTLANENAELKRKVDELMVKPVNMSANQSMSEMYTIKSFSVLNQSVAALNRSGVSSVADLSMNQSMTSEAALCKLEQNLRALSAINQKLQEDNTRLRRERDYYRTEASKLNNKLNTTKQQMESSKVQQSHFVSMTDNSVVYRFRQENEALQNQKKALLKKLESLSKENASGIREEFIQKEKKLKQYEQLVDRLKLQNIQMANQLQETNARTEEEDFFRNENIKLKKINSQLLEQIKSLKIELSLKNDNLYNSRVIEMQNQLDVMKSKDGLSSDNKKLLDKINELEKKNTRLKTECQDYKIKLEHQTTTIEKLMRENAKGEAPTQKHASSSSSTKEKAYSEKCDKATVEEVEKYRREIKKLQEEIIFLKKSSDAINRSRDLTLQMDGYYQQKMEVMKKELEAVYHENENLSKMCERYGKDAREANKQLNKWKQKAMELMKAKAEESILLSNN